jgi:negative regulator of sigma E activity
VTARAFDRGYDKEYDNRNHERNRNTATEEAAEETAQTARTAENMRQDQYLYSHHCPVRSFAGLLNLPGRIAELMRRDETRRPIQPKQTLIVIIAADVVAADAMPVALALAVRVTTESKSDVLGIARQ